MLRRRRHPHVSPAYRGSRLVCDRDTFMSSVCLSFHLHDFLARPREPSRVSPVGGATVAGYNYARAEPHPPAASGYSTLFRVPLPSPLKNAQKRITQRTAHTTSFPHTFFRFLRMVECPADADGLIPSNDEGSNPDFRSRRLHLLLPPLFTSTMRSLLPT